MDTDICVFALRERERVLAHMMELSPDDVAVTAVTEAELYYGALRASDAERARKAVDRFLAPIARLPFDSDAAEQHARLRQLLRNRPIGERDLMIASIACAKDATLVTHNTREFSRIGVLALEDWSQA
jgi:tRNA(fMet)-specific endonuclease VapC